MNRDQNFQKISWFWDLNKRGLLNLNPPYQRRSVWNQEYKDYFIDTILLNYPAPAIFLYEETSPEGRATYNVVDGKQRLTSIFEFVEGSFPVGPQAKMENYRGLYFKDLPDEAKKSVWNYKFSVEYVPSVDELLITAIFDRINRNVAKLSPQELRHARYDGVFMTACHELTEYMTHELPPEFPRIAPSSRRQMKDIEFTAELLLFLELGTRNFSQADLDTAFSDRDEVWDKQQDVEKRFRDAVASLKAICAAVEGEALARTRLRNQADFYSLFAAIDTLRSTSSLPQAADAASRLASFITKVEDPTEREKDPDARNYYEGAKSNSNDPGQRKTRIDALKKALLST